MTKNVVVLGAGFAGLSAAALLAKKGFSVTLLEQHSTPGGRARMFSEKGFSFDMGPSWYLMPDVFERFFTHFSTSPDKYYSLQRLNPSYRLLFSDETIDIPNDVQAVAAIFDRLEPDGGKKFLSYLQKSEEQYTVSVEKFLYKSYHSYRSLLDPSLASASRRLVLFGSIDSYVRKFFSSEKARQILEYTMVFLGGSPSNTPALYNMMSHADFNLGVWYPQGGLNAVARGIARLGEEQGVKFVYDSVVEEIIVEKGAVTGVRCGKNMYPADIVVSGLDYHHTETALLEKKYRQYSDKYWAKRVLAPGGLCMYLGVKGKIDGLLHHNLFLQHNWQEHFETIFSSPSWPERPSYYICAPSRTEEGLAPEGCENLFILIPVAAGLDDSNREEYGDKILEHLEGVLQVPLRNRLLVKKFFSHRDFISDYNTLGGSALGLSHTFFQSAMFRPRQKSSRVKGLYFTGQTTHPGVGVPMCLVSSEVVSELVSHDFAE